MKTSLRLGIALITIAMLTAPLAFSQSTRDVHETYYDAFVPEPADFPAEPRDATINCGADKGQEFVTSHDNPNGDDNALRGGDEDGSFNQGLPCWDDPDHLWTDGDGSIIAASAPFYACQGDIDLEVGLQNPFPVYAPESVAGEAVDPARQGVIVSSGSFYVIPEIGGEAADQVEAVWFSFLETAPTLPAAGVGGGSDEVCADTDAGAVGASGAYYEFYRGDIGDEDGWTIPVNTLLVPDNMYGAKLTFLGHSDDLSEAGVDEDDIGEPYPGGLDVLGMGYVYAIVDNTQDDTTWSPCTPSREACDNQDTTPPWPQIVPGDVPFDGHDEVEITFGEHVNVDATEISIDGVSEGVEPVGHDHSDVDSFPLMEQDTDAWGERYVIDADLSCGTTIDVNAVDLHGNQATKSVTLCE